MAVFGLSGTLSREIRGIGYTPAIFGVSGAMNRGIRSARFGVSGTKLRGFRYVSSEFSQRIQRHTKDFHRRNTVNTCITPINTGQPGRAIPSGRLTDAERRQEKRSASPARFSTISPLESSILNAGYIDTTAEAEVRDYFMPNILKCPFCGSKPKIDKPARSAPGWQVFCPKCDTVATRVCATESEAVAVWNARAPAEKR